MTERSKVPGGKKNQINADVNIDIQEHRVIAHHGENVKHYRTAKSLTQEYMAAELKITQPKFSEIEKRHIIDENLLEKISNILNLGIEWLRDIPITKGFYSYHQDGNGNTNFQNTGDVNYNINNPVDQVAEAYRDTVITLKETINTLTVTIETEKKEKMGVLDRFVNYVESQKH